MSEIVNVPMCEQRDIQTVTAEIRTLQQQAQRLILEYSIEIGRRLTEAKTMVEHGQWGRYLQEELGFSTSTADNHMLIYREYGDAQFSLFGARAKSQTLGNLTYTKALKLIAIPEDEREAFVQEHDVEKLSTRALDKLIREREEAEKAREAAEEETLALEQEQKRLKDKADELTRSLEEKEEALKRAEAEMKAAGATAAKMEKEAKKARAEAEQAKADLQNAQNNPVLPLEKLEEIRAEEARKAAEEAEKQAKALEGEIETLRKEKEMAENAVKQLQEDAERSRKKLAAADPDVTAFKVCFEGIQKEALRLKEYLKKVRENSPETAEKLGKALEALADSLRVG